MLEVLPYAISSVCDHPLRRRKRARGVRRKNREVGGGRRKNSEEKGGRRKKKGKGFFYPKKATLIGMKP